MQYLGKFLWGTIAISWGIAVLELFGCATVQSTQEPVRHSCQGGHYTSPTGAKFYAECRGG